MDEAVRLRNEFLLARGIDWATLDDRHPRPGGRLAWSVGDEGCGGGAGRALVGLGLDGLTVNLPANGHDPDAVAHTVGVVKAAVG